jgi:hypothetical protein
MNNATNKETNLKQTNKFLIFNSTKIPQFQVRKSFYQTCKRPSRVETVHLFDNGKKFLKIKGFLNVTDQDLNIAIHTKAREGLQSVIFKNNTISKIYPYCVSFDRKQLSNILRDSAKGKAFVTKIKNSMERWQATTISHNLYEPIFDVFSIYQRCWFNSDEDKFYFAFSDEYMTFFKDIYEKHLKAFDIESYYALKKPVEIDGKLIKSSFAKIIYPVLKSHFDSNCKDKVRKYSMRYLLQCFNKYEWIKKGNDKNYMKRMFKNELFPAFAILEAKKHFMFRLFPNDEGVMQGKYKLDSVWTIVRLYTPNIKLLDTHFKNKNI